MDKETEIKHLRALGNGDTYFAQFFKSADIEQMAQNIKNDFPIEYGCQFNAKADSLKNSLKELGDKVAQEKFDTAVEIFRTYPDGDLPERLLCVVQSLLNSRLRVIEAKVAADVCPTREEVAYLIQEARK